MTKSFIEEVLNDLIAKDVNISQLTFVLPSIRAGNFLKSTIAKLTDKTLFSPEILSIEEFIENVSLLKSITNTELLFELYRVYLEITPPDITDDFDSFCKWAQIIIQDFNEIDRYLIPQNKIFSYLSAIKEVDHWSLSKDKTELVTNYLSFWGKLPQYYKAFKGNLVCKGLGYQGLLYREALDKLELYIQHNPGKKFVFLGFNALNTAEQRIIQELLHQELADIYWDIDAHFMNSKIHDAGLFVRQHKQWNYYQNNVFNWVANNYCSNKNINAIGIPKNVGQAKYVGEILSKISKSNNSISKTAVVLGDENLLLPVLNSIPKEIGQVNISMGMSLQLAPLASLFDSLFRLHKILKRPKLYYKDVLSITSNHFIARVLNTSITENVSLANNYISKNNITHIGIDKLLEFFPTNRILIALLFDDWENNSQNGLKKCKLIIQELKNHLNDNRKENLLPLEYLFKFNQVFNQISMLLDEFDYAKDIKSLLTLYREMLSSETLDFQGEPLQGLQVIGMLESRVIDFETLIITSVNEGILPSGKGSNSFIPFDVKLEYGLPTYKEKDAVYTYHFYHLLQRAKNVYILYNTEVDALNGGEKSRFITQLEVEGIHEIEHYTVAPKITSSKNKIKSIHKSEGVINRLKEVASIGFSPSSLTSYMRNPMDFYYQKILGINAFEDVEETVASNTFGTIIHNVLEDLYIPLIGEQLTPVILIQMKSQISGLVSKQFKKEFRDGSTTSGKNFIILEITKRYLSNFIDTEIESLHQGKQIKILALEKELRVPIDIPALDFPVYLKGTVDRIDECDGVLRIIDYKTGNVTQGKVEIIDWEEISTDYDKYSKSFQILTYAYMQHIETPFKKPVEAGIISFKNLKNGLLKFGKKDSPRSRNKDNEITEETLLSFSMELKKLIQEICDPETNFIEKEV